MYELDFKFVQMVSAARQHARFTADTAHTERENVHTMKEGADTLPVLFAPPPGVGWPAAVGRRPAATVRRVS
jgi:hypothetical protein